MAVYDCAIVGGGFAGLQAAIQLGRYRRRTIVFDTGDGRSTLCGCYRNLLGWPDGANGPELRTIGRSQAERLGVEFVGARIDRAERRGDVFVLTDEQGRPTEARRLLLATGIGERLPDLPELLPCLGYSVYICPDCDGFETAGRRTIVIGSGEAGARLAMELVYWTNDIVYVNHGGIPPEEAALRSLEEHGIAYVERSVVRPEVEGTQFKGVLLADGTRIEAPCAFTAMGGNRVRTELAVQLGVALKGRHVEADARTKQTNVRHVWAAGDIVAHSQQAAIAMGDGAQAAIWMHKSLLGIEVPAGTV